MICSGTDFTLPQSVWDCLRPPRQVSSQEWISKNVRLEDSTPFSFWDYHWATHVCAAFDNSQYETISIQASAQTGKSVVCRALLVCGVVNNPGNAIFATADKELAQKNVRTKVYPLLDNMAVTREQLRPEHDRLQTRVDLRHCSIFVGWSGSPSTLGDITARYGHAAELDKWNRSKSDEADPGHLFGERAGAVIDSKFMYESTPTVTGHSRINARLLSGTNSRIHCPCPHCGHYQQLIFGTRDLEEGGITWDKLPNGKSDPELARKTARYRCRSCQEDIEEVHRMPMIRKGVCAAEGQTVNDDGTLEGAPVNDGPDFSIQISRMYAPATTFGKVAREFLQSCGDSERMRNFINSWLGETYTSTLTRQDWQEVADRLTVDMEPGVVPPEAIFVTTGVDVQVDHLVYVACAWGLSGTGFVIDYGICHGWDELDAKVLDATFSRKDDTLSSTMTLIDARFNTDEVKTFCQSATTTGRWVWPLMGSKPGTMQGKSYRRDDMLDYKPSKIRKRKGLSNLCLIHANTGYWQSWIQSCLSRRTPGDPGSLSVHKGAAEDEDWWTQLVNEAPAEKVTTTGHVEMQWVVVDESRPVDFRDALRYARVAAEVYVAGAWNRLRAPGTVAAVPQKTQKAQRQEEAPTAKRPHIRRGARIRRRR